MSRCDETGALGALGWAWGLPLGTNASLSGLPADPLCDGQKGCRLGPATALASSKIVRTSFSLFLLSVVMFLLQVIMILT